MDNVYADPVIREKHGRKGEKIMKLATIALAIFFAIGIGSAAAQHRGGGGHGGGFHGGGGFSRWRWRWISSRWRPLAVMVHGFLGPLAALSVGGAVIAAKVAGAGIPIGGAGSGFVTKWP